MNATACDLNGKVENWAATNVLRGDYVEKEILCIKDVETGAQIYSNSFAYGLYSDLIELGDRTFAWCCWKRRYMLTYLWLVYCRRRVKRYHADVEYENLKSMDEKENIPYRNRFEEFTVNFCIGI